MTEKWFESSWANATPLIIFILFMIVLLAAQAVLHVCNESNSRLCSSIDIKTHILFKPQKVFADEGKLNLIKDKDTDGKELETYAVSRKTVADRYSGQIVWVFFAGINILISVVGLTIFLLLAIKTKKYKYVVAGLIFSLLVGTVAFLQKSPIISPIVEATMQSGDGGVSYVGDVVKLLNFLAVTTMLAMVLTISAILFRNTLPAAAKGEKSQEAVENKLRDLSEKVEDLRLVLYFATALLIVGVLQISSLLNWMATFFPVNELKGFFSTITFVFGCAYTILLASIYLPAYYVLQNRAMIYVNASLKSTQPDSLQSKEDLPKDYKLQFFSFSVMDTLPRVLIILAPLLTGTVTEQFLGIFNSLTHK